MAPSRRSTVGNAPLFHPVEVGSNPGGGIESTEHPETPTFFLAVVLSIVRAYLKVHGGPGPAVHSVIARRREPWR